MFKLVRNIFVSMSLLGLAGCGETAFQDAFDAGKYSPDETKVRSNKSLTLPPDLQLRAPQSGGSDVQPSNNGLPPVSTQPPQYGTAPAQPPSQPPYGTAPQASYTPPAGQQPPKRLTYEQNIYKKWGVSEFKADGTKKTKNELLEELRAKKLAQQQKKNKNYGTIFNLPNVFKDD